MCEAGQVGGGQRRGARCGQHRRRHGAHLDLRHRRGVRPALAVLQLGGGDAVRVGAGAGVISRAQCCAAAAEHTGSGAQACLQASSGLTQFLLAADGSSMLPCTSSPFLCVPALGPAPLLAAAPLPLLAPLFGVAKKGFTSGWDALVLAEATCDLRASLYWAGVWAAEVGGPGREYGC